MTAKPTRRNVLITLASAGIAGAGALVVNRRRAPVPRPEVVEATPAPAPPPGLKVLNGAAYATLVAACDVVYPRDDTPGASDLRVPLYIDWALARTPRPSWSEGFRTALARLDVDALERFAVPFFRAPAARQSALLTEWAEDADEQDNPVFVHNLVLATMEGALGDPSHGGNQDGQGWKAFGIAPDRFSPSRVRQP